MSALSPHAKAKSWATSSHKSWCLRLVRSVGWEPCGHASPKNVHLHAGLPWSTSHRARCRSAQAQSFAGALLRGRFAGRASAARPLQTWRLQRCLFFASGAHCACRAWPLDRGPCPALPGLPGPHPATMGMMCGRSSQDASVMSLRLGARTFGPATVGMHMCGQSWQDASHMSLHQVTGMRQ